MSQNKAETTEGKGLIGINTLVLLAILLAAGFILNLTVGKALSAMGIQPEFIIAAFCLTILLARSTVPQALVIGLVSAAVIQITTSTPGVDFIAEGVAAMLMALLARVPMRPAGKNVTPLVAGFVTTFVSGSIYAVIATLVRGGVLESALVMAPVVLTTAIANCLIVQALYFPLARIVPAEKLEGKTASRRAGTAPAPKPAAAPEATPHATAPSASASCAGTSLIELDGVSFAYAGSNARALDGVDLTVRQGDFLGIIGPSGAGKSTLTAAMSGAIPHHFPGDLYGAVRIEGRDTCDMTLTDISKIVGSVLQDIDAQMVAAEVEDEILYGLENFGVPHDEIPARVDEALATAGIEALRHREIATLSGGQKQKVAVAAILALRPHALVLDEPTAALDPASSRAVYETLRRINREQGVTVVVVEQKVALLSSYCNRVAVVEGGRLALEGTPHEVFSHGAELRAIGVDSPRVARVRNSLVEKGVVPGGRPCLTVDEAVELIAGTVAEKRRGSVGVGAKAVSDNAPGLHLIASSAAVPRRGLPEQGDASRTEAPVASLKDVSFTYPGGGASVQGISFDVLPGEFVAVVGANGAGKTTLTKLLNGLYKPASGSVVLAGLDTRTARASEISAHAATLFQNPDRQICQNTVLDEVAFGLTLHGTDMESARARARAVVDRFDLPADEAPFSLSRGQRQIVALASVIAVEPDVLILDEPTSGLDYRECMTVMQAVEEQRERGCAVIMVCHDMEVASDFADRLIVMAGGRVLADGDARGIFSDEALMQAASVEPPQAMLLSSELARHVDPAYRGLSEVSDIVDVTARLCRAADSATESEE